MAPTDTFQLVDRIVPGGLDAFLEAARDEGQSYRTIASRLLAEHDIEITSETIRQWCNRPKADA